MHIQQLYTNCLSEAAYYIESEGVAAIIDPMRDVEEYIQLAKQRGAEIKYIFETHFHADFVSGHIDLSKATGATIIYGPDTRANFPFHLAKDGEVFALGKLSIKILHTPGHTLESTCFLLLDENGKQHAVFTGDTLFVGDVGRPDLAQKGESLTTVDLAGMLYDSLQSKIVPLNDDVIVYPAHGPGSSCGKNLGPNTQSTIGEEKQTNYALKAQSKEDFIKAVTEGLDTPPQYFPINAKINKEGYQELDTILEAALTPLSVDQLKEKLANDHTVLVDTRQSALFTAAFIPGSIFIGLEGRFAEWAGSLLPFDKSIVLVTDPGKEKETAIRLARVGFDKLEGYLDGGFEAWQKAGEPIDMIIEVEADEVAMDIPFDERLVLVDVRREIEYDESHIKEAVNIPLSNLTDPGSMANINDDDNLYIHCQSGYRSVIAASLIKRQGIHNLRNVLGGFNALKEIPSLQIEKSASALN
ncbi:rhodanese-like domain-containing protein [Danxiaibacter flavus]|uniref:Rhodanese-like domain-containing protein n=1 Tax=Danxiaibacter flavus TaxID=3049108 RepID=A0ABV3ZLT3_9BACT|nr:rhodanese-like domain-containing protein [Chitinophagaceae bacterium DXS]